MARSNVKPSYEDFEPYCKWRIEEGKDTIEVHLHGFRKEQVRVQLSSIGNMTITGERRVDESRWTRFRKEIKVPKECNNNEVRANLSTGILYIVMPKKITLPSSQDQVNQENGQSSPKINQDTVAKDTATENLDGSAENNKMTTENATMLTTRPLTSFIMQLRDSFLRLQMGKKMGMNVTVAVALMIALVVFVIYKHRHVEN
ncbi:hypothetical protein POPTR_013G054900v4 [Populus trichocarpa]|uniref:SHSP domain-containing protein n=1 Tax=Populus trichocarpa TaxID=3694 RepID=B9I5V4_POPTR|nr:uncharacterized protein LOC7474652 [Populus trichocarpa]KAI5566871.1 hypothetical protein BDE02_13G050500 [Populus trichocarpa]PNT06850.1 hypothetical protein POPTR_013G054900v4 [Populus trichocarpa]|eukprot:XP_002319682.1 uncharacterized protein LOC7474652 [Populus trichocarpa]